MRKTILPAWHVVLLRRRLIRTCICFVISHFCLKRYMNNTVETYVRYIGGPQRSERLAKIPRSSLGLQEGCVRRNQGYVSVRPFVVIRWSHRSRRQCSRVSVAVDMVLSFK
jgi:hypothetical protein